MDSNDLPRVGQRWRRYLDDRVYRVALLSMLEPTGEPAVSVQAVIGDGRVWTFTLADFMGTTSMGEPCFKRED